MLNLHQASGSLEITGDGYATILAALIGAIVLVAGFGVQRRAAERERRAAIYGEAIRAVEDYLEAPFLILRRENTPAVRREITTHISEIQSRIAYYRALLGVHASEEVAAAYVAFIGAARTEAGRAMTTAWQSKAIKQGSEVPIHNRFSRRKSDQALALLTTTMRRQR
ncbi:hypothetical protein [Rathayibacter sp. PhB186]|nr:hypothetical protein [Rathayibacter sp. PhB186]